MGSPQTTILAAGQPVGFAGMATRVFDSKSAANKEASANIQAGIGVKPGTAVSGVLLPTASSSVLEGIVKQLQSYAPGTFGEVDQGSTPPGYVPNTMLEIVQEGRIFVVMDADAAVTPNTTRLYWRFETDGASNTIVGAFRNTDDGHVVDTTKQVKAIGPIFTAADGVTKICEVYVSVSNKP
jgi:hypothetical protein